MNVLLWSNHSVAHSVVEKHALHKGWPAKQRKPHGRMHKEEEVVRRKKSRTKQNKMHMITSCRPIAQDTVAIPPLPWSKVPYVHYAASTFLARSACT